MDPINSVDAFSGQGAATRGHGNIVDLLEPFTTLESSILRCLNPQRGPGRMCNRHLLLNASMGVFATFWIIIRINGRAPLWLQIAIGALAGFLPAVVISFHLRKLRRHATPQDGPESLHSRDAERNISPVKMYILRVIGGTFGGLTLFGILVHNETVKNWILTFLAPSVALSCFANGFFDNSTPQSQSSDDRSLQLRDRPWRYPRGLDPDNSFLRALESGRLTINFWPTTHTDGAEDVNSRLSSARQMPYLPLRPSNTPQS